MPTYQVPVGYEPADPGWDGYGVSEEYIRTTGAFAFGCAFGIVGAMVGIRPGPPSADDQSPTNPLGELEAGVYFYGGSRYRVIAAGAYQTPEASFTPEDVFYVALLSGTILVMVDDGGSPSTYQGFALPGRLLWSSDYKVYDARWLRAYLYANDDTILGGEMYDLGGQLGFGAAHFDPMYVLAADYDYSGAVVRFPPMEVEASSASPQGATVAFQPMDVIGADYAYAQGEAAFRPLDVFAIGGVEPLPYASGAVSFDSPYVVGFGSPLIESAGTCYFAPLDAIGAEGVYAQGRVSFPGLLALGLGKMQPTNFGLLTLPGMVLTMTRKGHTQDVSYTVAFGSSEQDGIGERVRERPRMTALVDALHVARVLEQARIDAQVVDRAVSHPTVVERVTHQEVIGFALTELVTEAVQNSETLTPSVAKVEAVLQRLVLSPLDIDELHAAAAVSEALTAIETSKESLFGDVVDAVTFAPTMADLQRVVTQVSEQALFAELPAGALRVYANSADGVNALASMSDNQRARALVVERIAVGGVLALPDGEYTWVVNTESTGVSEYTNYPFNSFAFFNGRYLGATQDGLFELNGDTDDGVNIDAMIRSGLFDLGSSLHKRISRAYIGYTSTGRLLLKLVHSDRGVLRERWYELKDTRGAPDTERFVTAKGPKARYWQYELANADGADFEIDNLQLLPIVLTRRV